MSDSVPSNQWNTPWRASGLAVYDTSGNLVAHTGITGNRSMHGKQLELMAAMIAEAVNAYSAGEPPGVAVAALRRIIDEGDYTAPEGMTRIAREALEQIGSSAPPPSAVRLTPNEQAELCEDCPPTNYPTDRTRCAECPRATATKGEGHGG